MGKIGQIISVVTAVVVNVIPGVGQAISGAIVGALGGTFAAVGIATGVLNAITLYGIASGLSIVGGLLGPSVPRPEPSERQVRNPTPPRVTIEGQRRSYGALVGFETNASGYAVDVVAFADGRAQSIEAVFLNDDRVTLSGGYVQELADERYRDNSIQAGYNLGAATETAHAAVIAALPGIVTTNHRGDGVVSGYLIKKPVGDGDFLKTYPQGDGIAMSLVINSWHRFDPRLEGQDWNDDDTWAGPFDNPVLGLLRYLVVVRGEDYATRIAPVIDYWIAAANICDSARALKAGGTEKLYRCAIMYDSTAKPSEVISEFLKTMDGWMGEDGDGHILIYAGALYTPTVDIGPAQIVDYEVKSFVEDEDRLNEIVISYVSDQHDWNTVEASAWRDESDIAERGRIVSTTFSPQVPSHAQAQYLAKREAARVNAQYSGTCTTTFSGRSVIGQRYVNLLVEESGAVFFDGIAEIISVERNAQTGGVIFAWKSVSAALDDWNPATEEGEPAPVGERVPLTPAEAPEITATDVVTGPRVEVTAAGPDQPGLTWYLRWRLDGETVWTEEEHSGIAPGASVVLVSGIVPSGSLVEVQVAYRLGDGRFSDWSATEDVTIPA